MTKIEILKFLQIMLLSYDTTNSKTNFKYTYSN